MRANGTISKAERTRERIIKAAADAVRARGPGRVSVAEVMTQLNLTHGGFYAHFASKDAMVAAAVEEAFRGHGRTPHRRD